MDPCADAGKIHEASVAKLREENEALRERIIQLGNLLSSNTIGASSDSRRSASLDTKPANKVSSLYGRPYCYLVPNEPGESIIEFDVYTGGHAQWSGIGIAGRTCPLKGANVYEQHWQRACTALMKLRKKQVLCLLAGKLMLFRLGLQLDMQQTTIVHNCLDKQKTCMSYICRHQLEVSSC